MVDVNPVPEERSERKAFSQHVQVVQSAEQHRKSDHLRLKSVRYRFVHPDHISMVPRTCASNARKVSINPNHNKRHAFRVHQITVRKQWPPPVAVNAQIHAKQSRKAKPIVTSMPTAFWCRKRPILSVNVNLVSMELEWNAKMCVITSVIIPVFVSKI